MANVPIQAPADFRYYAAYCKGRPQHDKFDPFLIRHPSMKSSRRAKIFSPFDALRGFRDALCAAEEGSISR
ncbi:MAG: hypothetical protein IKG67_09205 [Parasporobacterium sp.]|nr:hypothetical protein [Parasporobacterium sp.]